MQNLLLLALQLLYFFLSLIFFTRLILQWRQANENNPVSKAVISFTQPIIGALQKIFPVANHFNTACLVVVLLIQLVYVLALEFLFAQSSQNFIIIFIFFMLRYYFWAIIIYAVFSFIPNGAYHPLAQTISYIVLPVLHPLRKYIPQFEGIDFSPLIALIIIIIMEHLLSGLLS